MRPLDLPRRILAELLRRIGGELDAQHDYAIANADGASVRADINNALSAIVSLNSGPTAPATTFAYMFWADTTTGLLKVRNAANSAWVTVGMLASTNLGLAPTANPTFTGTVTAAAANLSGNVSISADANVVGTTGADSSQKLLVRGTAVGVRIGTSATVTEIEGVDNTGGASFQPLALGGSYVYVHVSGTEIARANANGLGVFCTPTFFEFDVTKSKSGAEVVGRINNSNAGASSNAKLYLEVNSGTAGDPYIMFEIASVLDWVIGVDNSDSDKFKISQAGAPGTNDFLSIDTTGAVVLGSATPATGYASLGDLTLPSARGVRAKNTDKALLEFDGTGTPALHDNWNVTSLTDNGVGDYTVNFTNALGAATYTVTGSANAGGGGVVAAVVHYNTSGTKSTTACQIYVKQNSSLIDSASVSVRFAGA